MTSHKVQAVLARLLPIMFRLYLLLITCETVEGATVELDGQFPTIHLRSGRIDTGMQEHGLNSKVQRRRLLSNDCHTDHPSWGHLSGKHQVLLSYMPGVGHEEKLNLFYHLSECNVHISGYLPDHTLVLIGSKESLIAASNHSAVVWAGYHEPEWKLDPAWENILSSVERMLETVDSPMDRQERNDILSNISMINAVLHALPAQVFYDSEENSIPRLGIKVVFPWASGPSPYAHDHPRSLLAHAAKDSQAQSDPATASAEDWQPILRRTFAEEVDIVASSPSTAIVIAPLQHLRSIIGWLINRPSVHWVEPVSKKRLKGQQASSVIQSGLPANDNALDPGTRPFWASGITGAGQVVGTGDSGLDVNHCFFTDPEVPWPGDTSSVNGIPTFISDKHRKIALYHGFADFMDGNGHGTHTSGTLAGIPYSQSLENSGSTDIGMAPGAKIAFIDLSGGGDDLVLTPYNLARDYFGVTKMAGAQVHSDSWGSDSTKYDDEAAMIDEFCWQNPEFIPVFPSGNDGDYGAFSGQSTVNSPATAKNVIAAGATLSTYEMPSANTYDGQVWTASTSVGSWETSYRVLQSDFSPSFEVLEGKSLKLVAADPLDGCNKLTNAADLTNAVSLIERGGCNFDAKARFAEESGAAAVLIFDSEAGAYFVPSSVEGASQIPVAMIPRRQGRNALALVNSGRDVQISFSKAPDSSSLYGFEDLAEFSSQGPVIKDNRVKPDFVAPGTIASAKASSACGISTYGGTSMSTPVIAGAALLARQYFMDGFYPSGVANSDDAFTPSSALIKAVFVAGASSLQGFEADTGLPIDPPPSFRQGFGRINLGKSLPLPENPNGPKSVQLLDKIPIAAGETHTYCLNANGGIVTVALVWTDLPANPSANKHLVNDLDLIVRSAGLNGERLLGNGGDFENPTIPDSTNNIELVELPPGSPGKFSIEVSGSSVQEFGGPQPYAIVVNGDFDGVLAVPSSDNNVECDILSAIILSGPGEITNNSIVEFELGTSTGNSNAISFECKLEVYEGDAAEINENVGTFEWTKCSNPVMFENLADGTYIFNARIQGDEKSAEYVFTKDNTPPSVSLDSPENELIFMRTFEFTSDEEYPVEFECKLSLEQERELQTEISSGTWTPSVLNLGEWFSCSSPQTIAWLFPGKWAFEVKGRDLAGNIAENPERFDWSVMAPNAQYYPQIISGPFLRVSSDDVVFTVKAVESSSLQSTNIPVNCAVTEGIDIVSDLEWKNCSTPVNFGTLDGGTYSFVAAIDIENSLEEMRVTSTFVVDTEAPSVNFIGGTPSVFSENTATIEFEVSENDAVVSCELQKQGNGSISSSPCTSPVAFSDLEDGKYILKLSPSDAVGNVGELVIHEFFIDTSTPVITKVSSPTAFRNGDNIEVSFEVEDASGSPIEVFCKVSPVVLSPKSNESSTITPDSPDSGWQACTSPFSIPFTLAEGHWRFSTYAVDLSGLQSAPVDVDIWIDTIAPVAEITSGPTMSTVNPGASVGFTLVDGSLGASEGAASPVQWQALLKKLTDEELEAYRSPIIEGNGNGESNSSISISGNYKELEKYRSNTTQNNVLQYHSFKTNYLRNDEDLKLGPDIIGSWVNCTGMSSCDFDGLDGGAYVFQSRGIDLAGNIGEPSETYAFELEGESGSEGLPLWALIAIIVGGVVFLLLSAFILLRMCRRCSKKPDSQIPHGAVPMPSQSGGYTYHAPPSTFYQASNGHHIRPNIVNHDHGYQNGFSNRGAFSSQYGAPIGNETNTANGIPEDPVEAQQLALAIALSQNDSQNIPNRFSSENIYARNEDQDMRRAIEDSLRESNRIGVQGRVTNSAMPAPLFSNNAASLSENVDLAISAPPYHDNEFPNSLISETNNVESSRNVDVDEDEQLRRAIAASLVENSDRTPSTW